MSFLPKGLYTALITPFQDGKVDFESLEKLLDFQIAASVPAVVLCGTTGESSTLTEEEKYDIAKFSIDFAKGKTKIIIGTGSNNTAASASLTKKISQLKPDGFLIVSPYYNKATDEGLSLHFKEICKSTDFPVILYNVPSRTALNMSDSIIIRIREENKNVAGLKDATGNLARVISLRSKISSDFLLLSGEDSTALAFNASGGDGIISVVSNIAPNLCGQLQTLSLQGKIEEAVKLQMQVHKIAEVLFSEVNPIPVKFAAFLLGLCQNEYRLPLCPPSREVQNKIKEILPLC